VYYFTASPLQLRVRADYRQIIGLKSQKNPNNMVKGVLIILVLVIIREAKVGPVTR
jgi:hypothetical protein